MTYVMLWRTYEKILNKELLNNYIDKHNIESIFDKDILKYAQLHFYEKEEYILKAESNLEYYYLIVDGKIKFHIPLKTVNQCF